MIVDDVPGMTSARVQTLLNRCVGALPSTESYLEIGCWQGATLISALRGHTSATAVACDNFAQFTRVNPREKLRSNLARYAPQLPELTFFDGDCFELAAGPLVPKPVGVYFYDGNHDESNHVRALTDFRRLLAREAVVLVDDWNFDYVRRGTWRGIDLIRPKSVWFRELPSRNNKDVENFWNGVGAFHIVLR